MKWQGFKIHYLNQQAKILTYTVVPGITNFEQNTCCQRVSISFI